MATGQPSITASTDGDASRPSLTDVAPGLVAVAVMLAIMWGEEIIDLLPGVSLDGWGIRPRRARGLLGIVFAPFLHTGFAHLVSNTIPFALLGGVIALSGTRPFIEITVAVGVISGLGVWIFGASNSVHLGASGLVFGYITYLVSRGVFAKRLLWILGGLVVAVVYGGSLVWGLLPNERMSCVAAAWLLHANHDLDDESQRS